jgi:hypothetical protein
MSTAFLANDVVQCTSFDQEHPASYEKVLEGLPKASAESSTQAAVSATAVTEKKMVQQEALSAEESKDASTAATDHGQKDSDKKTWPGHKVAESVLAKMQAKFGNQPGPKVEESIAKTAKEAAEGVKDTWRLARKASDSALAEMQKKFGNHSERANDPTIEQQLRKMAQDTLSDAKNTLHQAQTAFTPSKAAVKSEAKEAEAGAHSLLV